MYTIEMEKNKIKSGLRFEHIDIVFIFIFYLVKRYCFYSQSGYYGTMINTKFWPKRKLPCNLC